MGLKGTVVPRSVVSASETKQMVQLLNECFSNVDESIFLEDLERKDEVLLLRDCSGAICGFSTLLKFRHSVLGHSYRVVFSGDTVISPGHWGGTELPAVWGAHLMRLYEKEPQVPLLWLLISKGIRTFKFLPVFFKRYYPSPDEQVPADVQKLMHSLGESCFGSQYDRQSGLVLPTAQSYFLREEFAAEQTAAEKRSYIEHFYSKNPAYRRGAELLCLTEFSPGNLKPFISRRIVSRLEAEELKRYAA